MLSNTTMNTTIDYLKYGWNTRRAWWFVATSRTKERYARTVIGSFWLGLSNLLSIAVLGAVYRNVFKIEDFGNYIVYLGIGLTVWTTIASSMQASTSLYKTNADRIRNTSLNPIFYALEEWAFQAQTFFHSFGLVVITLSIYKPVLFVNLLTAGLAPLINLLIFIYWIPLLMSLVGAGYEDFYQIVPIALQLMFLLSPILYLKQSLGPFSWIADCNPIYIILNCLRHGIIHGSVNTGQVLLIALLNIIGVYMSTKLLSRKRKYLPFIV